MRSPRGPQHAAKQRRMSVGAAPRGPQHAAQPRWMSVGAAFLLALTAVAIGQLGLLLQWHQVGPGWVWPWMLLMAAGLGLFGFFARRRTA